MALTPRDLEIERLELRVALGGRSAGRSAHRLDVLRTADTHNISESEAERVVDSRNEFVAKREAKNASS